MLKHILNLFKKSDEEIIFQPAPTPEQRILTAPLISAGDEVFERKIIEKTGWTLAQTKTEINNYRHFLVRCLSAEQRPSQNVDEVWHQHILFIQDYQDFCYKNAGRMIYHKSDIETIQLTKPTKVTALPPKPIRGKKVKENKSSCSSSSPADMTTGFIAGSAFSSCSSHSCSSTSSCSGGSSCGSSCGGGGCSS